MEERARTNILDTDSSFLFIFFLPRLCNNFEEKERNKRLNEGFLQTYCFLSRYYVLFVMGIFPIYQKLYSSGTIDAWIGCVFFFFFVILFSLLFILGFVLPSLTTPTPTQFLLLVSLLLLVVVIKFFYGVGKLCTVVAYVL